MTLADKFPRASAAVLTAALAFLPGAYNDVQAEQPKMTTDSTSRMTEEETKNSELWKAAQFSKRGCGDYFIYW